MHLVGCFHDCVTLYCCQPLRLYSFGKRWMDEYEAVKLKGEDRSTRNKNSPGDHAHHKSHMDWPGIEHGPPHWEETPLLNCKNRFFSKNERRKEEEEREKQKKNKTNKNACVTPRSGCEDIARIRFRNKGNVIFITWRITQNEALRFWNYTTRKYV